MRGLFVLVAVVLGIVAVGSCQKREPGEAKIPGRRLAKFPATKEESVQRCESCGEMWLVIAKEGEAVPERIEWCPFDGKNCEDGLRIYLQAFDAEGEKKVVEHCRSCEGCRKAFYSPSQWREVSGGR